MKSPEFKPGAAAALVFAVLLLTCLSPAAVADSAGDWGLTVDADATLRLTDDWAERNTAYVVSSAFWSRYFIPTSDRRSRVRGATVSGSSGTELAAQLSYTWTDERLYLFDADLLRIRGTYPGLLGPSVQLQSTLGRFRFTEPSGGVFNHNGDGAELRIGFPRFRLQFGAAYTGFMLNPSSDVRVSQVDLEEAADEDGELLGPARAVGIFTLTLPQLIGRHSARISVVGQRDLRSVVHGSKDTQDIYHSGYYSLLLDGPVVPNLFYDISTTVSTGLLELDGSSQDTLGLLASARLRLFRQDLAFSRASVRLRYASGNSDTWDAFVPVVRSNAGTVLALPLQNMILGEVAYSLRPFSASRSVAARNLQTGINARSFFLATKETPATVGVKPQDPGRWLGSEIALNLSARPTADLGFSLTGAIFIPETGSYGVFSGERRTEFYAKAEISSAL